VYRQFIILTAFLYGCVIARSQTTDTVFVFNKLAGDQVTDFTVDNLGNLYILSSTGQIKKMNAAGDSIAVFNNIRQYGKIYLMDVTNPLKLLLYFRDFGTIVVLDRFLSTRATIDLRKQQLFQVNAIGQSYDNNIWVFDELESKLKRVNEEGRVLDQTTDFRVLLDSTPSPQFIVDHNRLVYLYDSLKGVYLFDYYGAFKNRIQLKGWTDFTVINGAMYGRDAAMLYRYEPGTLNLQHYSIPAAMRNAQKIKITPGNLYVLRNNRLEVYSYR
jgi:hypothetical protein